MIWIILICVFLIFLVLYSLKQWIVKIYNEVDDFLNDMER